MTLQVVAKHREVEEEKGIYIVRPHCLNVMDGVYPGLWYQLIISLSFLQVLVKVNSRFLQAKVNFTHVYSSSRLEHLVLACFTTCFLPLSQTQLSNFTKQVREFPCSTS